MRAFLIPMALSLGFGVLFATVIILVLVPALYMVVDDASRFGDWVGRLYRGDDDDGSDEDSEVTQVMAPAE